MTVVAVVIPEAPRGAVKSWRKLVTGIRPGASGTFGIDGPFLGADRAVELPAGALVIACDVFAERRVITAYCADGALEALKSWERKGPLGKSVCNWVARRLAPGAASHLPRFIEDAPNRYEGRCCYCRNPVPAGQGRAWRTLEPRVNVVAHRHGHCPPPAPPPQRVEPSLYAGPCFRCGGWVASGEGAAVLTVTPAPGEKPSYAAVHGGDCPPVPEPGPRNGRRGWCHWCGGTVEPGGGCWQQRPDSPSRMILACYPECGHGALGVPWWVLRAAGDPGPGDVILARVRPGTGRFGVPEDAPGYRVLPGAARLVQFAVAVLETDGSREHPARRMQVRAATWEEAAPVLAEDAAALASAAPFEQGFMARWAAQQYLGRKPWLARITGYDPKYGYQREFMRAARDWRTGSASGHRLEYCWTLRLNEVYEAWRPDGGKRSERAFIRATPEGDVTEISEEEVTGWLALRVSPRVP